MAMDLLNPLPFIIPEPVNIKDLNYKCFTSDNRQIALFHQTDKTKR
jgi:hypothetical protein